MSQPAAKCTTCSKALNGAWNMTKSGESYNQTGRYLGISNGYFLYGGSANWVYCYCQDCWKKHILSLSFVKEQFKNIKESLPQNYIPNLENKRRKFQQEIDGLKARLKSLGMKDDAITNSCKPIQQEINKIDQQITVLR